VSIGQDVFRAVAEFILPLAGNQLSAHEVVEIGFESDSSQCNDDAQIFESFEFALQIRSAVGQFRGQRLVVGRRAAGSSGYVEIMQNKPVVSIDCRRLTGKSRCVEHRVHKVAGSVSGERAPGAIGAVGAWSKSEHKDAGMGIAEAGNGLAPVLAVAVSAALLAGNLLAIQDEARTARAGDDFGIQNLEPVRDRHSSNCICLCVFVRVERAPSPAAVVVAVALAVVLASAFRAATSCRRGVAFAAEFRGRGVPATQPASLGYFSG
jgi:hypothetical protein